MHPLCHLHPPKRKCTPLNRRCTPERQILSKRSTFSMKKARFCVLFSWRRVWDSNYVRKPRWGFHAPVQTLAHTFILFSLRRKENASESLTQYNDPLRSNSARGSYLTCIFRLSPGRRPAGPGLPWGAGNIQRTARIYAAHKRSFRPLPGYLN